MIEKDSEFLNAIEGIASGSEAAIWEFIETYGPHIKRVVRHRLHQQMRSKFDSVDFVQMVWASFFADPKRIAEIQQPDQLVRYLSTMARNKVVQESRRRMTYQKHNVNRERSLDPAKVSDSSMRPRHDTPSEIAIAKERWHSIMRNQSERNRRIVQLRMNGATYVDIGKRLGINERTARQVIDDLACAPAV